MVTVVDKAITAGDAGLTPGSLSDLAEREEALHHRAETTSRSRLSQLMNQIRAEGGSAEGDVGDSDPLKAIGALVSSEQYSSRRTMED